MNATYVQAGRSIDYTPTAAVAAGDIVVLGSRAGIAKLDIAANELGALALDGVFDVVKADATVFADKSRVFWDVSDSVAVAAPTSDTVYLGQAIAAAASGETTVRVLLGDIGPVAAAVANLAADATLATSVSKVNDLLASLRAAGLLAS